MGFADRSLGGVRVGLAKISKYDPAEEHEQKCGALQDNKAENYTLAASCLRLGNC